MEESERISFSFFQLYPDLSQIPQSQFQSSLLCRPLFLPTLPFAHFNSKGENARRVYSLKPAVSEV